MAEYIILGEAGESRGERVNESLRVDVRHREENLTHVDPPSPRCNWDPIW